MFTSVRPINEYLIALLDPGRLVTLGIASVPHGQSAEAYVKLLKGTPFVPPVPRLAIQVDVEQDVVARAARRPQKPRGTCESALANPTFACLA